MFSCGNNGRGHCVVRIWECHPSNLIIYSQSFCKHPGLVAQFLVHDELAEEVIVELVIVATAVSFLLLSLINQWGVSYIPASRLTDFWCRSGEFCVYNVVVSHPHRQKICNICFKFSQPASSFCFFTCKWSTISPSLFINILISYLSSKVPGTSGLFLWVTTHSTGNLMNWMLQP